MKKRIFSLLLALAMIMSYMPAIAFADPGPTDVAVIVDEEQTGYESIAAAVQAADNGQTVKLISDASMNTSIDVSDKQITIVGDGHTITATALDVFTASSDGIITLGQGLTVNCSSSAIYARNGGKVIIDGADVSVNDTRYSAAFATGAGSAIEIKNGSIKRKGSDNVTISVKNGASVTVSGGSVENEGSSAIAATGSVSSSITITGGEISNSNAGTGTFTSAAVYGDGNHTINISGGTISSPHEAVQATGGCKVNISGGTLTGTNLVVGSGFNSTDGSEINVSGGTLSGGAALATGGTINILENAVVNSDLAATQYGGNINISGGEINGKIIMPATGTGTIAITGGEINGEIIKSDTSAGTITISGQEYNNSKVVAVPTGKQLVYNGSAQAGVVGSDGFILSDGISSSDLVTATIDGEGNAVGTNAGSYIVKAILSDGFVWDDQNDRLGEKAITFSIAKAAPVVKKPTPKSGLKATGSAQALINPGSTIAELTIKYAASNNITAPKEDAFSESIPTGTAAGTYYVWFMVVGNENYYGTGFSQPITVTIDEASDDPSGGGDGGGGGGDTPAVDAAVQKVIDAINALPAAASVKITDKKAIEDARAAYDKLTADQKKLVDSVTYKKLEDAEAALKKVEDQAAADAVKAKIDALPAVDKLTTADKAAVEEARKAYDALSADQKKLIDATVLKKLTDSEDTIKKLEEEEAADEAAKKVKTVTVNTKTVSAKAIANAVAKAGGSKKYVTKFVLGSKVSKISKNAFKKYTKAKTLVVKTKKLSKAKVKGSLKGSKITKIQVKVGSKKVNKKYVKKYKKIFTKKNAGKKVKVV